MFGRKPRLPIDLIIPSPTATPERTTYQSCTDNWKEQMTQAFELASRHANQRKTKDCDRANTKSPRSSVLFPGDRVLVRNMSERGGTGKLRSFWEEKVHTVLESFGEKPVLYKVQAENDSNGRTRNLHRNMLMLCDDLLDNFNWDLVEKDQNTVEEKVVRGTEKVKNCKRNKARKGSHQYLEEQKESSEDELPQFTPAGMRPLLRSDVAQKENQDKESKNIESKPKCKVQGKTEIGTGHKKCKDEYKAKKNIEKKVEIPEHCSEAPKVDFKIIEDTNLTPKWKGCEVKDLTDHTTPLPIEGQLQSRIKGVIEVEDMSEYQTQEQNQLKTQCMPKEGQRQIRIKDFIEVEDMTEYQTQGKTLKHEKQNQTKKQYNLRSKGGKQAESNYDVRQVTSSGRMQGQSKEESNSVSPTEGERYQSPFHQQHLPPSQQMK